MSKTTTTAAAILAATKVSRECYHDDAHDEGDYAKIEWRLRTELGYCAPELTTRQRAAATRIALAAYTAIEQEHRRRLGGSNVHWGARDVSIHLESAAASLAAAA